MHIMQTKRMPGRYGRLAPERGKQPRSRTQIVLLRRKRQKSRSVKFSFIKPRSSDLNKSTALRMTTTLLNEKFLSYNEETRKYQLGYCALALGISKLASIDLIEVSRPILEELANRSNMFIHLAILEDEKVVVISKIFPKARMQSTTQLMSQIGGILPMHCTGIGLLFLSQHDDKYCREFLSRQPLDRYTTTTQTEIPQIMERIQNIRDLQYVINNGEHDEGIVKQQSRQLS